MSAHDADYRVSKNDWDTFVDAMTEKIVEKDETIPELPAKDLVRKFFSFSKSSKTICRERSNRLSGVPNI